MYASSRLSDHLSAAYNESMTLRFTGKISIEKMSRAMERLVERHDALRASFDEAGLLMKIASSQKIAMPVYGSFFHRRGYRAGTASPRADRGRSLFAFSSAGGSFVPQSAGFARPRSRRDYLHRAPSDL